MEGIERHLFYNFICIFFKDIIRYYDFYFLFNSHLVYNLFILLFIYDTEYSANLFVHIN